MPRLPVAALALLLLPADPSRSAAADAAHEPPGSLVQTLARSPFRIAYESYVGSNWEILATAADGGTPVNLTKTPGRHEHYPQVSPDGRLICFLEDSGEGRETVRSLQLMEMDGRNRRRLAGSAREPFWSPDGRRIGFLEPEYPRFNVMDYATRGMAFVDIATGQITPHPNSAKLRHLYNPCFAPNGRWILATAHAGMGVDHGIVLIEAAGPRVVNLGIPGCRGWIGPDGHQIAWGAGDHEIAVAPIDLESENPTVGSRRVRILDAEERIIHVDWSPDGRFLCFSRGPAGKGDPTLPGTFAGACGIVGVYAAGWNLCTVSAERNGILDLRQATDRDFFMVTTNGNSNKEPAWFLPARPIQSIR